MNFCLFLLLNIRMGRKYSSCSKACISRIAKQVTLQILEKMILETQENKLFSSMQNWFHQSRTLPFQTKPFNNDEKCYLFHPRSSFCSQEIQIFVVTFCSCRKMAWLEKEGQFQNWWRYNVVNKQLQYQGLI